MGIEEFNRSVWGLTSIASAVWLFKRDYIIRRRPLA